MHTACEFTACPKSFQRFLAVFNENTCLIVDFNTSHSEMKDWFHQSDVEFVVYIKWVIMEKFLVAGIFLFPVA